MASKTGDQTKQSDLIQPGTIAQLPSGEPIESFAGTLEHTLGHALSDDEYLRLEAVRAAAGVYQGMGTRFGDVVLERVTELADGFVAYVRGAAARDA